MAKNIDDWFIWIEANRDTPASRWEELVLPEAKRSLYIEFLELIGTDHITVMGYPETTKHLDAYRNEQRQALKEYFNL